MKKILLILLPAILFSCASLPDPTESNIGMVAFMHELENTAGIEIFGQYRITIEGIDTNYSKTLRIPKNTGITKFYLEPGAYKISKIEFIYDHDNRVNNMTTDDRDLAHFKIEQGKIIIVKRILNTTTSIDGDYYVMTRNMKIPTDKDIKKAKEKILSIEGSHMWDFK